MSAPTKVQSDARQIPLMYALELALDVAWDDPDPRALAVAAEAWTLAGYNDGSIEITSTRRDDVLAAVAAARKGRPARLLRADARGMVAAFSVLIDAGILTTANAAEAHRQRWIARGGHDQPARARALAGASPSAPARTGTDRNA